MSPPKQNARAEKVAGTSDAKELLPKPQVRVFFLFPQVALREVTDDRLHSQAHR